MTNARTIIAYLASIQMGETEAGEILQVSRDAANAYYREEDARVTMAEYGLML